MTTRWCWRQKVLPTSRWYCWWHQCGSVSLYPNRSRWYRWRQTGTLDSRTVLVTAKWCWSRKVVPTASRWYCWWHQFGAVQLYVSQLRWRWWRQNGPLDARTELMTPECMLRMTLRMCRWCQDCTADETRVVLYRTMVLMTPRWCLWRQNGAYDAKMMLMTSKWCWWRHYDAVLWYW